MGELLHNFKSKDDETCEVEYLFSYQESLTRKLNLQVRNRALLDRNLELVINC